MSDFRDEIFELFEGSVDEAEFGVSTGWDGVDAYYKVVPGELTIVTGVPNSGKSEWIDALMVNLAAEHNWSFALCSMENRVRDHGRKLAEKHAGKSFFGKAWYSTDAQRIMTRKDLEVSMNWLEQHFCIIRHDSDAMPNIEWARLSAGNPFSLCQRVAASLSATHRPRRCTEALSAGPTHLGSAPHAPSPHASSHHRSSIKRSRRSSATAFAASLWTLTTSSSTSAPAA